MKYNIASKLENSKNYTPIRGAESKSMTFILGARCSDGVVLVADKKVSAADCSEYDYENKLVGEIRHVIFGASGSSEMFQLYRGMVMDYINSHPGEITFRNAIYKLSALAFASHNRYMCRYWKWKPLC